MKKLVKVLALVAVLFAFTGCFEREAKVRIANEYGYTFVNVSFGKANFGTVNAGTTTGYQEVESGYNSLSGRLSNNNGSLYGGGDVSSGKHTLTISSSGTVTFK